MSRISKLAELVAQIPMKPPTPSVRTRAEVRKGGRDALELGAKSPDGCTEAMPLAQGFKPWPAWCEPGWRIAHVERVRAGTELIEVRRPRISDAGHQVIGRR